MAELDLDEYRRQMDGICTTSVDRCTLDEAPGAYKDTRSVLDRIDGHAVQVRYIVYPKINIKAAE
jgi:RNA-splicing ligase RtcB